MSASLCFNPLYILSIFLFFESASVSMQAEESTGEKLYSYLKIKLAEIERHDPPFYQLTSQDDKIVYILGSIHDRHPEIILSAPVFQAVTDFSNESTLFTEHASLYDSLLKKLDGIHTESQEIWNPENFIETLSAPDIEVWKIIKDEPLPIGELTLKDIGKIDKISGAMFLYAFAGKKSKEIGTMLSFEQQLLQLDWFGSFGYLEGLEEAVSLIQNNEDDLHFFKIGLKVYNRVIELQDIFKIDDISKKDIEMNKLFNKILVEYERTISNYSYEKSLKLGKILVSHIERNKIWCSKMIEYLQDHHTSSIFVVCGSAHLKGVLNKGSNSFLELLWNTGFFKDIKRINKEGGWVSLD